MFKEFLKTRGASRFFTTMLEEVQALLPFQDLPESANGETSGDAW
jgi:hypothetical protein